MVMAWRFGAVAADGVIAVVMDATTFPQWMVAVPDAVRADPRWPEAGSMLHKDTGREPRGKHTYDRRLTIAIVEEWQPPQLLAIRLRSGLGGWVRVTIKVHDRPGGCLVEVSADPLTASARLRYSQSSRAAEERCATVAATLIQLAMDRQSAED